MERIKAWLSDSEAALIVTDVNRKYLTNFISSAGYLIVTKEDAVLLVDGRYILAAKTSVMSSDTLLLTDARLQLPLLIKEKGVKRVHIENTVSVKCFNDICKMLDGIEVDSSSGLAPFIEGLREVKTEYETECIVKAQSIAEKAFDEVLDFIKPGVAENEVAALLEYKCKCFGSEKTSFDTIVVAGQKSAMPHGVPDGNIIKNGDFVTMDFGAVYNGYHSDMTRTVAVGYATDKMQEVYDTVLRAMEVARGIVAEGIKCSDVDKAARSVIENAGYGQYFTHSTGHSVGLEIHESPSISPKSDSLLKCGNIITDEPGIYIDGEFGVRIEDILLVTKNGAQTLTKCKNSLIIL